MKPWRATQDLRHRLPGFLFGTTAILLAGLSSPLSRSRQVRGDLRLHEFASRVYGNTRQLRVLVPAEYDAPENRDRRYPVLYLNDGQNLFDSSTSVLNPMEWRVDETVQELTALGRIPPMIVVGIDNAGRRGRFREYFPWFDEYLRPPDRDPQGTRYPEFLVDEVMRFVNSRYRTLRDPGSTGLGGSSAGGLAAIYAVIHRPGVFGRLLVESPSIYVDSARILREAASVTHWPQRVYLGVGTNESGRPGCSPTSAAEPELVRDVRRLERIITASRAQTRVKELVIPCAVHNEAAWGARLPEALTFLFGAHE